VGGHQPLRRAEKKRFRSTVPHDTFFRKPSSLLPLAGSQPPTPYPSPPGGGGLKRCATNPFARRSEGITRALQHGPSAPLPLEGRGEGWGASAPPAGREKTIPDNSSSRYVLLETIKPSAPCRLTAPHPYPSPPGGWGLKRCATNPFARRSEGITRSLRLGPSAPLPLVGRGEGNSLSGGQSPPRHLTRQPSTCRP
jgi:hypothetical protein